jgi:4-hydroxy-tetrahydrodipicolinate reductase
MADVRIGVLGCNGRMGQAVLRAVAERPEAAISGAVARSRVGEDVGEVAGMGRLGIVVTNDAGALFKASDAVVDFTLPQATAGHANLAASTGTAYIVGTTGLGAAEQAAVDEAARFVPVVQAANFSLGVNLLAALVRQAARVLDADFDIEIVEMHHRHKVDAPSGTALLLGNAAAQGRGVSLDDVADRGRDGHTGARIPGHIGFAALRGGDVAGDHTVLFAGPEERIELTHKAGNRMIFARGAIKAALWATGRAPGIYGMAEVLGLE